MLLIGMLVGWTVILPAVVVCGLYVVSGIMSRHRHVDGSAGPAGESLRPIAVNGEARGATVSRPAFGRTRTVVH